MNTFDNSKLRKYDSEVEKKWSNTKEYNEYKEKTKNYSKEKRNDLACEMTDIFKEFSICFKNKESVESVKVQNLVKTLQDFITKNYYLCTDEILASLIKTYIQLCLAISHQPLTQKASSPRKIATTNEKYTFRTWLLRLGLIGEEFKTTRNFLLENLDGDIAFRNGRPETQMA